MKLTKLTAAVAAFTASTMAFASTSNIPQYDELKKAIEIAKKHVMTCAKFDDGRIYQARSLDLVGHSDAADSEKFTGYKYVDTITCALSGDGALLTEDNDVLGSVDAATDHGALVAHIDMIDFADTLSVFMDL